MLNREKDTLLDIKRLLKRGDILLILALLAIAWLLSSTLVSQVSGHVIAVILQDGKEIARIRLNGLEESVAVPFTGDVSGLIVAEHGQVHFQESGCRDQVCVHTGWLAKPGQVAACLPAKVLVRIEGERTDADVDVVLN